MAMNCYQKKINKLTLKASEFKCVLSETTDSTWLFIYKATKCYY